MDFKFYNKDNIKYVVSKNYNSLFNTTNGFFMRWGKNKQEDPECCDFLPEILDIEISQGECSMKCTHCYKSNGEDINTKHMTLTEFKNIFHKIANTKFIKEKEEIKYKNYSPLQQIAFGITDVNVNPDFFEMMKYAKSFGVIPNYTTNGMFITKDIAEKTKEICGAVAVSVYENKNIAYNAIKKFTDAGMTQVNIHFMLAEETYDKMFKVFEDLKNDERLAKLNAIVLLGYKPKGNGIGNYNILCYDKFKYAINYALDNNIPVGFDSCTAHKFIEAIKDRENAVNLIECADPCESSCFSSYVNCDGKFYACSFCEGEGMWKEGIDVLSSTNFSEEVWNNSKTKEFREMLLKNNRKCPMFNIDNY